MACYVSKDNQGLYFEDGFSCACADSTARLEWKPDGNCIAGSTAASSQPAACRYHKYGDRWVGALGVFPGLGFGGGCAEGGGPAAGVHSPSPAA